MDSRARARATAGRPTNKQGQVTDPPGDFGRSTLMSTRSLAGSTQFGTVQQGKLTDLVILDADPLDDVAHLRRIALVMRKRHAHTRNELVYPPRD